MTLPTISTMPSQGALSVMIVDDESPARARLPVQRMLDFTVAQKTAAAAGSLVPGIGAA